MGEIVYFRKRGKIRKNTEKKAIYHFCYSMSFKICFDKEKCRANLISVDKSLTEKYIRKVLYKILADLADKIHTFDVEINKKYCICFTIFYYENKDDENDFKYMWYPCNLSKDELAKYIYVFLSNA